MPELAQHLHFFSEPALLRLREGLDRDFSAVFEGALVNRTVSSFSELRAAAEPVCRI